MERVKFFCYTESKESNLCRLIWNFDMDISMYILTIDSSNFFLLRYVIIIYYIFIIIYKIVRSKNIKYYMESWE